VHRLPRPFEELYTDAMPLPAISETTLALAYSERGRSGAFRPRTTLLLLDRNNGASRAERELPEAMGNANGLGLAPLGDALLITGREHLMILSRE
jgi:hypothetical protein